MHDVRTGYSQFPWEHHRRALSTFWFSGCRVRFVTMRTSASAARAAAGRAERLGTRTPRSLERFGSAAERHVHARPGLVRSSVRWPSFVASPRGASPFTPREGREAAEHPARLDAAPSGGAPQGCSSPPPRGAQLMSRPALSAGVWEYVRSGTAVLARVPTKNVVPGASSIKMPVRIHGTAMPYRLFLQHQQRESPGLTLTVCCVARCGAGAV